MAMQGPTAATSDSDPAGALHTLIDPAALMRIRNLQMRAKVVVDGFYNGLHRSPYHGFSVEFSEYRPYVDGEDTRFVDWRLYGRTDRFYIKCFEDETNRRVYLLVDLSRSMGYASLEYNKADYARTLAATLAYYFTLQRDSVGLLTFHEQIDDFVAARHRPGHMHQLMVCLQRALAGENTVLDLPIERIASLVTRPGLIMLISDMLAPVDTLQKNLAYLRSRGHEVYVLRTLDPAEVEFPFSEPALVTDMESQKDIYVDPTRAREMYQQQFRSHAKLLQDICDGLGIEFTEMLTDEPLERALYFWLHAQMQRGRHLMRRGTLKAASRSGAAS